MAQLSNLCMGLIQGWQPSDADLHSSREPGVRRPCSDFMDMLRRLIYIHVYSLEILIATKTKIKVRTREASKHQKASYATLKPYFTKLLPEVACLTSNL